MIETHTRILGIAPYDGMRTAMEQAAQAYPNVEMDIYTGDPLRHAAANHYGRTGHLHRRPPTPCSRKPLWKNRNRAGNCTMA